MSEILIDYLSTMNSLETQWSIYVDPENLDRYACTQHGGPDGWVCIGTPDSLSYGFVPTGETLDSFLSGVESLDYEGRTVRFNRKGIISAYHNGTLDCDFENWLLEASEETRMAIATFNAEHFVVCELPDIIERSRKGQVLCDSDAEREDVE